MKHKNFLNVRHKFKKRLIDLYQKTWGMWKFRKHLKPTDVFLVGHPKSGNTWLAYMLAIILNKDFDGNFNLTNIKDFIPCIHGQDELITRYNNLQTPRLFRNEWPVYPEMYPTTIYLVRDPRAVLVSYYHHYRTVTGDSHMTMEAFVDEYLSHGCIRNFEPNLTTWNKQILYWQERSKQQPVITVKYEEMVDDLGATLKKVLEFINVQFNQEVIELALNRGNFESMRQVEEQHGSESYPNTKANGSWFIRRGKKNSWETELPPRSASKIKRQFNSAMRHIGYIE